MPLQTTDKGGDKMTDLTNSERELVALGAAIASNCVPCVEYHIPEARRSGLTDSQIVEAVRLADKVRQVPAKKVLDAAMAMLNVTHDAAGTGVVGTSGQAPASSGAGTPPCCG